MPHDHAGEHTGSHGFGLAFAIGVALNAAYVVIEAVAGFGIHSVALLADAGHNLGDVIALSAAWLAAWLGMRTPTGQYTYGLRRASILAALANAIILLVVTGGIGWAAIERLITPEPTGGGTIIVVAVAGIVVNGVTALLFMSGPRTGSEHPRGVHAHGCRCLSCRRRGHRRRRHSPHWLASCGSSGQPGDQRGHRRRAPGDCCAIQ